MSTSGRVPRILVVEDDAMTRNAIVAVLTHARCEVLEANSAEAAQVSDSFDGIIDLLIADGSLKTAAGLSVAAGIVESRPNLRVIQVDAHWRENLVQEVRRILKPLEQTMGSNG